MASLIAIVIYCSILIWLFNRVGWWVVLIVLALELLLYTGTVLYGVIIEEEQKYPD